MRIFYDAISESRAYPFARCKLIKSNTLAFSLNNKFFITMTLFDSNKVLKVATGLNKNNHRNSAVRNSAVRISNP